MSAYRLTLGISLPLYIPSKVPYICHTLYMYILKNPYVADQEQQLQRSLAALEGSQEPQHHVGGFPDLGGILKGNMRVLKGYMRAFGLSDLGFAKIRRSFF